jgi:hypothetical protein
MDIWDPARDISGRLPLPATRELRAASWRLAVGAAIAVVSHGLAFLFSIGSILPALGPLAALLSAQRESHAFRAVFWLDVTVSVAEVLIASIVAGGLALGTSRAVAVGRALGWIFTAQSVSYLAGLLALAAARPLGIHDGAAGLALLITQCVLVWLAIGVARALRHRPRPARTDAAVARTPSSDRPQ